jgi:iron complex transport system ATP-binding protein
LVTIEINALQVRYGARTVLHGLTLSLRPGRVLGVVGPNGSGKSTLVKALAGQLPYTGTVRFDGSALRPKSVGYMPQDVQAPAALTVLDVALLGRIGRLRLKVSAQDLDAVQQVLQQLGVADLAGRYLGELSGGQRQLVFLAQALVSEPKVLLLDEPISALDIRHQLEVLQVVQATTLARGLCTVMVLHDLNAAARFADEVAILQAGRLLAWGLPAQVLTAGHVAQAFGVDAEALTCRDGTPVLVPRRPSVPA